MFAATESRASSAASSELEKGRLPWKYEGYPEFTKWVSSSNDFFLLRRFSKTSARVLLHLQYEIAKHERTLDEMDEWTMSLPGQQGGCGSFNLDSGSPREKVIKELAPLLKEYYDLLEVFSAVKARPTAHDYQAQNVKNWFRNHAGAIDAEEQKYIDRRGDLIAVHSKSKAKFRLLFERIPGLHRIFRVRTRDDRLASETTRYHSDRALDMLASNVTISIGLAMLFGPMWWLNYVNESAPRLGIITGFIFLFALLLSSTTKAGPYEVLAAVAAYAAVLMVFFQSNGVGSS